MTETKNATTENGLYAALAKVQAALPSVAKNKTGEVKKDGRKVYDYDYADLTDVSEAIIPLLGQNGLAFTAKPTLNASGTFVLAYSLLHSSGKREDGEYPLPSSGTPQDVGKAITYGRRYCLCAVTGVAPGGDDTDAAGVPAHKMDRGRDESWREQPPVNRRQRQEPAQGASPAQWETPPAEVVTDMDWFSNITSDLIPAATDADTLNTYWHEAAAAHEGGTCTDEHFGQIKAQIKERGRDLGLPQKAKEAKAHADAASNGKTPEPVTS